MAQSEGASPKNGVSKAARAARNLVHGGAARGQRRGRSGRAARPPTVSLTTDKLHAAKPVSWTTSLCCSPWLKNEEGLAKPPTSQAVALLDRGGREGKAPGRPRGRTRRLKLV